MLPDTDAGADRPFPTRPRPQYPYLSYFFLVGGLGKGWKGILVVMVVALVCSTADSIQNAMTTMLAVEVEKLPVPWIQQNKITVARICALVIQGPAIGFAMGKVDVLRMFLVADLITAAIVVPLFGGLWPFVTQLGATSGVVAGFASVIIQGWSLRKAVAQGFEQIGLPAGLYADETVVSFVLAIFVSSFVTFVVSAVERAYAHVTRTRRYVELAATKQGIDLEQHEEEFRLLTDYQGKDSNSETTDNKV